MRKCNNHQFIIGLEEEKNYLIYDESYLGAGYFIINKCGNQITKFMKIYIMNNSGFPNYGIRAFSVNGVDNPDCEFNDIEFFFRNKEDFDNKLYEAFLKLCREINGKVESIDELQHGKNNFSLLLDKNVIKLTISKDVYCGKQHPTKFIDINLGDDCSSLNYDAINVFYNSLKKICPIELKEDVIKKLLMLY